MWNMEASLRIPGEIPVRVLPSKEKSTGKIMAWSGMQRLKQEVLFWVKMLKLHASVEFVKAGIVKWRGTSIYLTP